MNAPAAAIEVAPAVAIAPTACRCCRRSAGRRCRRVDGDRRRRAGAGTRACPADSPFALSAYGLTLVGKILCYALCALALDLVWGYCGILSLGHGLFFALGGYAMGMYLMRPIGRDGVYQSDLPDFMVFLDWKELPWFWQGFDSLPRGRWRWRCWCRALLAFVFGWFAFRSRIQGVYLSIITQALTYAAMLLFFRNDTGFGGNNGLTDFKRILGFPHRGDRDAVVLFVLDGARARRRLPRVPRDRAVEARPRASPRSATPSRESCSCGYDPLPYKLFVWTFSAVLCGLAGRAVRAAGRASSTRARWRRRTRSRW